MAECSANESAAGRGTRTHLKRRGILAAAGTVVAGIAAKQMSVPVAAAGTVTLANGISSILNNETVPTYLHNTGINVFRHDDAAVLGESDNGPGVYGSVNFASTPQVPFSVGVYGDHGNAGGIGVHGMCAAASGTGVLGQGDAVSGVGVKGISASGVGVFGASNGNAGVLGITTAPGNAGLGGITNIAGTAAFAGTSTNPAAFAGFFTGDVYVNGNFTVQDPTRKHGAIMHPDGTNRILYTMESPESWIEDFGSGQLVGGKATVTLDKDFTAISQTDDYYVFLTEHGESKGLYVAQQTPTTFLVQERGNGTSTITFKYRVVARPKTKNRAVRLAKFSVPHITVPNPPPVQSTPLTPKVPVTLQTEPPAHPAPPSTAP